jgi:predicted metal-dependent hydrolase
LGTERQESVQFGSAVIAFTVVFRKRKHIGITVKPDMRVIVAAPEGLAVEVIRERVRKRAPWILKQLDQFGLYRPLPTPRQYLNGETHRYLGRQYRLKISEGEEATVKLRGRYLTAETPEPGNTSKNRLLVEAWYREHARTTFERRLQECLTRHPRFAPHHPPLLIRRLKTRWGSCSKAGRVLLNTELVQAPIECIDYVIVHELCHLEVPDHSLVFYRLLTQCMPDWKDRKTKLESLRI